MSENNKRAAVRIEKRIEIEYRCDGPLMKGRIQDISETGVFIDTPQPLPLDSELDFKFRLSDELGGEAVQGVGAVAWTDPTGMGVEFRRLSPENRERIRFFVASVFFGDGPAAE